jgi:hypothetical protein
MFLLMATLVCSQPVPGSLNVHWNEGASDCKATPQDPLQVYNYEPQTFILRQNPCASFEANFIYLLIGSDKALLIHTGAVADPKAMPLAKTILQLLRIRTTKSFRSLWHILIGIWIIVLAILSSHLFHRSRSCLSIWREFNRFSVSLTGPTELLILIWEAELWM